MRIGEKIRSLRKEKRLTQEQLGEYLNVSAQAVSKWETGMASPDIDMLPRLASFFCVSVDQLLDFDQRRIDEAVAAIVDQSVPLRVHPAQAEALYRRGLEQYPNNEVLLNCLLMVIPDERAAEKLEIGERLLDCTADDEIRLDVLRLLAETCRGAGEAAMAEHYLGRMPELYFLKTEVAAQIRAGEARLTEVRKTENVCFRILTEMLKLRAEGAAGGEREAYLRAGRELLELYRRIDPDHGDHAEMLAAMLTDSGEAAL